MDPPLKVLHLPRLRPPVVPPPEAGGPPSAFSATAKTTTRSPRIRNASDWRRRNVADEAYRAVFLRVHPTGEDGAQPHDPRRRQRARLRAARGRRARRARAGREEGRARGREPLRLRARVQRAPSPGTPAAITAATGKILAKAKLLAGVDLGTDEAGVGQRGVRGGRPRRARSPTSRSTRTAPARSRPVSKAGSTPRPCTGIRSPLMNTGTPAAAHSRHLGPPTMLTCQRHATLIAGGPRHWRLHHIRRTAHSSTDS